MFLQSGAAFLALLLVSCHAKPHRRDDAPDPIQMRISYYQDKVMTVALDVGTPAQTLNLALDTTLADIVVFDSKCVEVDGSSCLKDGPFTRNAFNPAASSTYANTNGSFVRWDDHSLRYNSFQDVSTLGGFTTTNTTIGLATNIGPEYNWMTADGLLGLGLFGMLGSSIAKNITHAYSNTSIATIWLDDFAVPNGKGVLTLGGIDSVNCEVDDLVTVSTTSIYDWSVVFTSAGIGSYTYPKKFVANIDTTARYTLVPHVFLNNIVKTINATYDSSVGSWFVPCLGASDFPPITFKIGGNVFKVKYLEYVESYNSTSRCELLFKVNQAWESAHYGPEVRLGHSWIRSYCNVFDYSKQTIGFTLANHLL